MRIAQLLAVALVLGGGPLIAQSQLSVSGQPYFGGSVTLSLVSPTNIGKPVLLAYGLNPLPLWGGFSSKFGPFYIGQLVNVIGLGTIGGNGRYDLPIGMPPYNPALEGIPIGLQAYVSGSSALSNPATIPLDTPYFDPPHIMAITSPQPSVGANFGDSLAVGDLNDDGTNDLVVGAWFEDFSGIDKSGRVYVLWGPGFSTYVALASSNPVVYGTFGASVTVADMNDDGVDDLIVAETPKDPPGPADVGRLQVYLGGIPFVPVPAMTVTSTGSGAPFGVIGRTLVTGDYDGDGNRDIAVGIFAEFVNGLDAAGRIDVYWGPTFLSVLQLPNPEPAVSDFFGSFLCTGDVNGDGIDDLVEGSGRDDVGAVVNSGSVHVFTGPGLNLAQTIYNPLPQGFNSQFGNQVLTADLNGDGMAEVIAADLKNRVYTFWSPSFSTYTSIRKPAHLDTENPSEISFGYFLGAADVNGDAITDILISDIFQGAMTGCGLLSGEGTLFTALGPTYATFDVLRNPLPACGDGFSWHLQVADVNGDRHSDIVLGSLTADANSIQNSGRVFILFGSH